MWWLVPLLVLATVGFAYLLAIVLVVLLYVLACAANTRQRRREIRWMVTYRHPRDPEND